MNDHIDLEEEYEQDTEEEENVLLEIPQQFNQKSLEESIFISNHSFSKTNWICC